MNEHHDVELASPETSVATLDSSVTTGDELTFVQRLMTFPKEELEVRLREYEERRDVFREWLLDKFVPGVHYGTPPGTAKFDQKGNLLDYKGNAVDPEKWQHKPSLYKAGALMLKDVLQLREEFEFDKIAWEQQGGDAGTFVTKCVLYDRLTGKPVSEGRGSYSIGGRMKADTNTAIKMAEKSALVDAVLHAAAIADLFTQDIGKESPNHDDEQQGSSSVSPDVLWKDIIRRSKVAWGDDGWQEGIVDYTKNTLHMDNVDRSDPAVLMEILKFMNRDNGLKKTEEAVSETLSETIRQAAKKVYGEDHWEDGLAGILSTDDYGGKALNELSTAQSAKLLAGLRSTASEAE